MNRRINVTMQNVKRFPPQRAEGIGNSGSTIPQVIELVTHRWLSGASERYLQAKYGARREWVEATARRGCNQIIGQQREELARLRAEMRRAA